MEAKVQHGQETLLLVIVALVGLAAVDVIFLSIVFSAATLIWGLLVVALVALLSYFLYQGHGWARWAVVALCVLVGVGGMLPRFGLTDMAAQSDLSSFTASVVSTMLFVQGILLLACGGVLLFSTSVAAFLAHQQRERAG